MSSKEYEINETQLYEGKTWWEQRPFFILMPVQSWVELKAFIKKVCKQGNNCKQKDVSNWENTVNLIDEKVIDGMTPH